MTPFHFFKSNKCAGAERSGRIILIDADESYRASHCPRADGVTQKLFNLA